MNISSCSLNVANQKPVPSSAQRNFYQWVLKWINSVYTNSNSNIDVSQEFRNGAGPDVPVLAGFLQAIGFKLISFEKLADALIKEKTGDQNSGPNVIKIAIECGSSNMKAVLELGEVTCQCPSTDHIKEASFWSVSGTEPAGNIDNTVQKVEETGSNLLPRLSKEVSKVLRDVSYRLFEMIACEPDVNRNTDSSVNISRSGNAPYERTPNACKTEIGVMRSYTQPEMRIRASSFSSKSVPGNRGSETSNVSVSRSVSPMFGNKPCLLRQKTWDMDLDTESIDSEPRTSPPKITSSPAVIAELSSSLGQISLPSDIEIPRSVAEYIIGAQRKLEEALKMLMARKLTISTEASVKQDQDTLSVKSAPPYVSPNLVVSPYKSTGPNMTSGIKPLSKLSYSTSNQPPLTKPTAETGGQIPEARRSIEPTMLKPMSRRSMHQLGSGSSKISIARRSFGNPPSAVASNISLASKSTATATAQKTLGNIDYKTIKTSPIGYRGHDASSRISSGMKKNVPSESQQSGISSVSKNVNAQNDRSTSMIRLPMKMSKAIPVRTKSTPLAKVNTGITKKTKSDLSKE